MHQAIAETRELCASLRPGALGGDGLVEAVRAYAMEFAKRSALTFDFTSELGDTIALTRERGRNVYRIAQEALSNVARHAVTATRIELNPSSGDGGSGGEDTGFKGTVQSESCPGSIVVLLADGTSVTVNISTATEIDIEGFGGSSAAQCSDIPANAAVEVEGVPQTDGSVNATSIHVEENELETSGSITSTNCAATPPSFSFTPDNGGGGGDNGTTLTLTIQPTTQIEVGDNDAASCTDLTLAAAEV